MSGEVYYKIYYYEPKNYITVVCIQWFDEGDYIENNFLKDENGKILKFYNENEAIDWMLKYIKEDKIDPGYRSFIFKQDNFMK
jgi:hypothetical protein